MDKKYISDNKRVILITGDNSKWYEQAIFIVKRNYTDKGTPTDFVREAEKIISGYMKGMSDKIPSLEETYENPPAHAATRSSAPLSKSKKTKLDRTINMAIIIACIALVILVTKGIIG